MTRTVLVTGASGGIGTAITQSLLDAGHTVIGVSRNVKTSGARFHAETIDLGALAALPDRLKELRDKYAEIDALVLNAGRGEFGSLEELSYERIRSLVDLNFTSQAYVARAFLPAMKREKRGDVVFIGSEAALSGGRRGAVYAATKAALGALARALREECGKSGVRVSVIHPGVVRTGFYDGLPFEPGAEEENAITPRDVADVVLHVLSARAGTVFDEIHLSPLKRVLRFRHDTTDPPT